MFAKKTVTSRRRDSIPLRPHTPRAMLCSWRRSAGRVRKNSHPLDPDSNHAHPNIGSGGGGRALAYGTLDGVDCFFANTGLRFQGGQKIKPHSVTLGSTLGEVFGHPSSQSVGALSNKRSIV